MDFDRLRAFVWILEEGSFVAAARRLGRTQPAVTRMLQVLEDQVGAELVDRRAKPLRATAVGAKVLQSARDILSAADRLTDGTIRGSRQTLRVGISRSLMWHLQDPRFVKPASPLRETDFLVRSGWSPRLYRRFARGEFDCAVLLLPADWTPDIPCRIEAARREPLVIIAPRRAHAPTEISVEPTDLRSRSWVLNPDGCGFRHALARRLAAIDEHLTVQFELDAAPTEHIAMVAAGVGCSIVPASALTQSSQHLGAVQQLTVNGFNFELAVSIVWSERCRPLSGTEKAFAAIFEPPASASRLQRATLRPAGQASPVARR
jgi:DNA-binding transcriptional LysR family regulator